MNNFDDKSLAVLMTVRNGEDFVRRSVESVFEAAVGSPIPVSMVIIDDGSTDATGEILSQCQARFGSHLEVVTTEGVGRGEALNLGLARIQGDFLAVQDADDLSCPARFAITVPILMARRDVAIIGSNAVPLSGAEYDSYRWTHDSMRVGQPHDVTRSTIYRNQIAHSSMLVRVDALRASGGYDTTLKSQFDWDMQLRLVGAGWRLLKHPEPLVARCIHAGSSFEARNKIRYRFRAARLQAAHLRRRQRHVSAVIVPTALLVMGCVLTFVPRLRWARFQDAARSTLRKMTNRLLAGVRYGC
jgi:glycosyltransferase involved in cell wall biosynthesis